MSKGWSKSQMLATLHAGEGVGQQEVSSLLVGMKSGTAILEKSLSVSYKITHSYHTIQQSCSLVCTLKSWKLRPHKILHTGVYSERGSESLSVDYAVHGILQARILEGVALPVSRGSSQQRDRTQVSHIVDGFFTRWATREARGL